MNDILISFIIPMYNAEKYIKSCVYSMVKDNNMNYELILVNDGSEDKTPEMAERLAFDNARVRVIHTRNNGQAVARNLAMEKARGKYWMFVDVDDIVILEGVESMLLLAEENNYDVVCASSFRIDETGKELITYGMPSGPINPKGSKEEIDRYNKFKDKSAFGYLWNKIYRSDFLKEHEIKFDEEKKVFLEDFIFNLKVMISRPKYYFTDQPCYNYDTRNGSTTRNNDPDIAKKAIKTVTYYYNFLKKKGKYLDNLDTIVPLAMRVFAFSLIKNVPHEGLSYDKIIRRVTLFFDSHAYNEILDTENAIEVFQKINSKAERQLYRYCYWALQKGYDKLLAATFFLCYYPVFRRYLENNVK